MSMRDIVQRLRSGVFGLNRIELCKEAADVIVALRTELEAARSTPMAVAEPPKQGEAVCEVCGGAGEVFEHADDCEDDLCALNGDQHSCAGKVVRCGCGPTCEDIGAGCRYTPSPSVEPAPAACCQDFENCQERCLPLANYWKGLACQVIDQLPFDIAPAPAHHQEPGWQPIETAPKDGRELILLLTPSRFPQVAYSNTWWTSGFSVECKPTHWMPLPPAPSVEPAPAVVKESLTAEGRYIKRTLDAAAESYALVTGGSAHHQEPGWQPIETAPKDMSARLLLVGDVCVQGFIDATGQWCVQDDRSAWRMMRGRPTHWAPLFAAPKEPKP